MANNAAVPESTNTDSINNTPTKRTQTHRFSSMDSKSFSSYTQGSPGQAKRALEAHLADTDRRIQDASKLGTTLLDQKQQLRDRLKDVQQQGDGEEMGPELKQKLADLEKEYHEVGKESARASLPRAKKPSMDPGETFTTPSNTGSKTQLPTSTRKTKNQPATRVHDIEFATEISTSLLGQVRQLQAQVAEKEEALRKANRDNSQLHSDLEAYTGRMRGIDDNEQRYKEENYNLETQVQDLTSLIKDAAGREERLKHALTAAKSHHSTSEREYEELRQFHGKLTDEHTALKRNHDLEISGMRRNMTDAETERELMQNRIEELTSQNGDLAKAIAYRAGTEDQTSLREAAPADGGAALDRSTPEHSPPASPTKMGTPRHGALESETLKSSLTHAHRMIQNLKNNIHREKTEKVELKRMLQDARDDLEARKLDGSAAAANAGRKRKPMSDKDVFKKPVRPDRLGGAKGAREDIINDPSWEEYNGDPDRPRPSIEKKDPYDLTTDASDDFETADENGTTDDTDAFHTGAESAAGHSEDELTETEGPAPRTVSGNIARRAEDRRYSIESTASDEGEGYDLNTPPAAQPRFKMRGGRGGFRLSETPSLRDSPGSFMSNRDSPASFVSNQSQPRSKQNLAAELEDLEDASVASNTPSRNVSTIHGTPDLGRQGTVVRSPTIPRAVMVDSGMLTEPWEPESKIAEVAAGTGVNALGGAAIEDPIRHQSFDSPNITPTRSLPGASLKPEDTSSGSFLLRDSMLEPTNSRAITPDADRPKMPAAPLQMSHISSQSTAPVAPSRQPTLQGPAASTVENTQPSPATVLAPIPRSAQTHEIGNSGSSQPSVPSLTATDHDLAPSTQAFLNDLLNRAGSRSRSGTPDSKRSFTTPAVPLRAAARDSQHGSVNNDRTPSFAISVPGRDTTPMKQQQKPDLHTEGTSTPRKPMLKSNDSIERPTSRLDGPFQEPTLQLDSLDDDEAQPSPIPRAVQPPSLIAPDIRGAAVDSRPRSSGMTESGTQTSMSGDQIDSMVKERAKTTLATATINGSMTSTGSPRQQGNGRAAPPAASTRWLESTGNSRIRTGSPSAPALPPLPADHREVIAAAAANKSTSSVNMPPPAMPASKIQNQPRPRTPSGTFGQAGAGKSTTPRNRTPSIARTEISHQSSISSFASEMDERFNPVQGTVRSPQMYTTGTNATSEYDMSNGDPRMIKAITQTMIGEFLWKYTRKAGRGEMSDKRHRRFFWIHPYTRTLYWSNHDPTASGKSEHKAKSVSIESVRVISDDNPIPPGIHTKSIVVVTAGRSIQFTAPTSQRHETWFNALSYLLLRNNTGNPDDIMGRPNQSYTSMSAYGGSNDKTTSSGITADDLNDFNPAARLGSSRTPSRFSHRSVSSTGTGTYNNRNSSTRSWAQGGSALTQHPVAMPSSPQGNSSLAMRQSQAAQKRSGSNLAADRDRDRAAAAIPNIDLPERSIRRPGSRGTDVDVGAPSAGQTLASTTEEAGDGAYDGAAPSSDIPRQSHAPASFDFKKPALPASATGTGSGTGTASGRPMSLSASTRSHKSGRDRDRDGEGRLSSLTSRFRRSSFASLGRRGRSGHSGDVYDEDAASVMGASGAESVREGLGSRGSGTQAATGSTHGHRHNYGHGHGHGSSSNGDGGLENVRACCDGTSFLPLTSSSPYSLSASD